MKRQRLPPNRFSICKTKDGVVYNAMKEVIDFLQMADAVPEHFFAFGSIFQRRDAAMRTLALYWVIRASQEQKLDLRCELVKTAYAAIADGTLRCLEKDGTQYFVRSCAADDPVCGSDLVSFGRHEKCIPFLDTYIAMKHL